MTDAPPGFTAYGSRRLRKAGAAGKLVRVALEQGALVLGGGDVPAAAWPLATIARIRVGYEESRSGKHFQTMVWRQGAERPVVLSLVREGTWGYDYTMTIRALAAELAATRGLGRVERGIGGFGALLGPVLIIPPFLAASAIALFALTNEPWWGRLIVPAVPTALVALLTWDFLARKQPKPVAGLEELEMQLP
jgi:hypothetical protein